MSRDSVEGVEQIKNALDDIRPALALHAGDLEFIKFEDGVVSVKMLGMCRGCPLSQLTLKMGIEQFLKKKFPEVTRVEAVGE
ncbi:MAG: NifU family protein [Patescibacteria group bacterium]